MKSKVKWLDNMTFVGESASGHAVVMDGPEEFGGQNLGIRPMEMLILGLGGCSAFDVMLLLKKSRQQVENCEVELDYDRAEELPKVFTRIHLHFVISGKAVDPLRVEKAISLSAEKLCSASIMLGKVADITHDYEIIEKA
ncbi:MAG: OsmC family protein [Gammaproteobacteria bacterium]|nr:OsmC family protein [Gammaproteobacteria bacterium]